MYEKSFYPCCYCPSSFLFWFYRNKPAIAESPDSTDEITINATSDLNDQGNSTSSVSTVSETNPLFIPTDPELNTKYGSGGISKITYVGGGQLYWYVKPATKWPYYFDGTIKVVYDSGHTPRIYEISGVGHSVVQYRIRFQFLKLKVPQLI